MEKFCDAECTLEESYEAPFSSLGACLAFWNNYNPARQKFQNLAEPESSPRPPTEDFAAVFGDGPPSPRDLWSSIAIIIGDTLKQYRSDEVRGWELRNKAAREATTRVPAVEDIAALQQVHPKKVYRYLKRINDDIVEELKRRRILTQSY